MVPVWAEPNFDEAAAHMISLFEDPAGGRALGARASVEVRTNFGQRAGGLRYSKFWGGYQQDIEEIAAEAALGEEIRQFRPPGGTWPSNGNIEMADHISPGVVATIRGPTWATRALWATTVALHGFLLVATVAAFVPLSPTMPGTGLDNSWVIGMNEVVAQGKSIGTEVAFTFGPYATVYHRTYHPATDGLMLGGSLYLALSFWTALLCLAARFRPRVLSFLCFLVLLAAASIFLRDALFFAHCLVAGLAAVEGPELIGQRTRTAGVASALLIAVLLAPLGLLPLVKGSLLFLCIATAVLCAIQSWAMGRRVLSALCLVSPAVSAVLFWTTAGQTPMELPRYFTSMVAVIAGYSEAMAISGRTWEIWLYVASSGLILLAIALAGRVPRGAKAFVGCLYAAVLFVAFKAGFVRHDGHAIIAGATVLAGAVVLPFVAGRLALPALVCATVTWASIAGNYGMRLIAGVLPDPRSGWSLAWRGLRTRIADRSWPRRGYDAAMERIRQEAALPVLEGATDIYSYDQADLISSGNAWSPRPTFQSYSAYSPALVEANRRHLIEPAAPANVIFRVQPIDGRLPALEDGVSWPALLGLYRPNRFQNQAVFLRRLERAAGAIDPKPMATAGCDLGEKVAVPRSEAGALLFARVDVRPSLWGRMAELLLKPAELQMTIELETGEVRQYRLVAGMARSTFLLSPLIDGTQAFLGLYGGDAYLRGKHVTSFSIAPRTPGGLSSWLQRYSVTFSSLEPPAAVDLSTVISFDGADAEAARLEQVKAASCDAYIDAVNGSMPTSAGFASTRLLAADGWAAASAADGKLPDAVYLVLTDRRGDFSFYTTQRIPRPDVGSHFKQPGLNESGFRAMVDVSRLRGQYTLGLAIRLDGKMLLCPQFHFLATFTD
jgi:hypothetical protein